MKTKIIATVMLVPALTLSLAACGDTWGQRAVTGGGIGAGAGLAVGALAGFPLLGSALVGTAVGAGVGAATAPGGIK
jgi:osmotically inducible lipoprotein OsmB